ncbi:MAG: ADP-ribosylglycohydrolase family protein [Deltaproteobacteria bacterium]|nr:ADP-ribosylglycohydrolase family protein [Deltaproteobacteria bacterium]MBW2394986.1 ADP-ribosylglycohydrolase family protein [Deltaproteobacteria bacterium]
MAGWATDLDLLLEERRQRIDEGCVVPADLSARIDALDRHGDRWNSEQIDVLYDELLALPVDPELAAREPNDLDAIRALRPGDPIDELPWALSEAELLDSLHGAWTGRCCGCAAGKPVEFMGMRIEDGVLAGRKAIKAYLQGADAWPLEGYIPERSGDEQVPCRASTRENIAYMEPDDDIHYSLVGLAVLEDHGPDFRWKHVAFVWTTRIPFGAICTAETQAILNFWNHSARFFQKDMIDIDPEATRMHRNPYREWIGAQIRTDGWAWACAGKPGLAAEFAHRDAHWTHTRNGIYGAMFCSAMQAAAFVEHDPRRLVEIGLSQIPGECRLALAVRECLGWIDQCNDWESCMERLEARYSEMSPVHTINNALICVISLVYGRMDTRLSTTISVMAGLDTDCNGATVGSIVGAASGRTRFNAEFAAPLNDRVRPSMIGFSDTTMRELAERHLAVWKRVDAYASERAD